jgi:hypothetical protein
MAKSFVRPPSLGSGFWLNRPEDLKAERLIRVLEGWDLPWLTMNIPFPTKAYFPAMTRQFLVTRFRENDYEKNWIV